MTVQHVEQGNFTSGMVSPRFWGRKELPFYQAGVAVARNMVPTLEGNLQRRMSTEYITADLEGIAKDIRLFPWGLANDEGAIIGVSNNAVQVWTRANLVDYDQILKNADFTEGLTNWTVVSGNVKVSAIYPGHISFRLKGVLKQSITVTSHVNILTVRFRFVPIRSSPDLNLTGSWKVLEGSTTIASGTFNPLNEDPYLFAKTFTLNRVPTGPLTAEFTLNDIFFAKSGVDLDYFHLRIDRAASALPTFPSPWTAEQIKDIQYIQNPFEDQMVFVHRDVPPKELTFTAGVWGFRTITFTGTAMDWGVGYPSVCGAYQGCLLLAASPGYGQTVWGSTPGAWKDFTTDALEFTLSDHGEIQWLFGHKQLVIGTTNGVYEAHAESAGDLFKGGNIGIYRQSGYSCRKIQGVAGADRLFYSSYDGRAVRAVNVSDENRGWVSNEVSLQCQHLVAGVRRFCWANHPQPALYIVTEDGRLLYFLFDPELEIYGWSQLDTDGEFRDVCTIREKGKETVYLGVRRNGLAYFERFALPEYFHIAFGGWSVHLDSAVEKTYSTPTKTITGLNHLNNQVVYVYSDGAPGIQQGPYTVTSNQITVAVAATRHIVGLPFVSEVRTLPMQRFARSEGHSAVRSWSKVGARLLYSTPPQLSVKDFEDEHLPSQMAAAPAAPIPKNFLHEIQVMGPHNVTGQVTVTQDNIWPMTIAAIYGKLEIADV